MPTLLTGGDWVYYSRHMVRDAGIISAWNDSYSGMGNNKLIKPAIDIYFLASMKLAQGIEWRLYERIFWFFPFLIFSTISVFFLLRKFINKTPFALLGSFLYASNTYALMLIGGGQNGIALAYSCLPFLILTFSNLLENSTSLKYSILFALSLSIITFLDIRVLYIGLVIITMHVVFFLLSFFPKDKILKRLFYIVILPFFLTLGIHSFWLLPLIVGKGSAVSQFGEIYTGNGAVKFFSFAFFENALALLHPNWPDNIFGKVSFMRPEFLVLPILAFSSLLFKSRDKKESMYIILFGLLGLLGVFLAKGANDPFGGIYLWMFDHIPGFVMFRDPTKWYMIIAISYSVLIPFTVERIYTFLELKQRTSTLRLTAFAQGKIINVQNIFLVFILVGLLFTIRQAVFGQLGGTFKQHAIPTEYRKWETFVESQHTFSRSLWIPNFQRFTSFTSIHPAIPAQDYYQVASISGVLDNLRKDDAERRLQEASVKYVVVPYDSEGELFLKDRKYDESTYQQTINEVKNISWLTEIPGFGKIRVFEVHNPKDHFWTNDSFGLSYTFSSPTNYTVSVQNAQKGESLIFAETFDSGWKAQVGSEMISATPYKQSMNRFELPKSGSYSLDVYYQPQQWVYKGVMISIISLGIFVALGLGVWLSKKKMVK